MAFVLEQWAGLIGTWMAWPMVLALALGLLSAWLRSAAFKGWLGEYLVRRWLAQDLDPAQYRCVHNATVRLDDGSTTQIDHVVLSRYGIFVLETKHLKGWIFGGEKQRTWTQTLFKHRCSFQNPLHQNWRHVKALEALLQVPLQHLHSGVVFTAECTFKTAMPAHVTQGRACTRWIRGYTQAIWSAEEVAALAAALAQQRLAPTRATHREHVADLQARHARGAQAVQTQQDPQAHPARRTLRQPARPSNSVVVSRKNAALLEPLQPVMAAEACAMDAPSKLESGKPVCSKAHDNTAQAFTPVPAMPELQPPACGACGAELVARSLPDAHGQMRAFWRCVHFPQCRWIRTEGHSADTQAMHSA